MSRPTSSGFPDQLTVFVWRSDAISGTKLPDSAARRAQLEALQTALRSARRVALGREARWSWARLVVFLLPFLIWWLVLASQPFAGLGVLLVGMVAFAWVVRVHLREKAALEFCTRAADRTSEARQRCGGAVVCIRDWRRPVDDEIDAHLSPVLAGERSWPLTDQERDDLDLYNPPVGVFGLLNRTFTPIGARRLRDMLDHPLLSIDAIRRRQGSVRALVDDDRGRIELLAATAVLEHEHKRLRQLVTAIAQTVPLGQRDLLRVAQLWSLISFTLVAAALVGVSTWQAAPFWIGTLVVVAGVNRYLLGSFRLASVLQPWRDTAWPMRGLNEIVQHVSDHGRSDAELGELREACAAVRSVTPRLARWVGWTERGGLVHALMNYTMLYDLHIAQTFVPAAAAARDALLRAIGAVGEYEALLSLACFSAEQPIATFPTLRETVGVDIRDGRHPLIVPTEVVGNDVNLDEQCRMWIITGSNMAGKSTLLRMVSVHVLLGQLGCAVTAQSMRWRPVRLITDLRARDDLAAHESYFLSEVRHLKRLLLPDDAGEAILGIIDEPFRGTNSLDQSAASVAVTRHLATSRHLVLLATHDRVLTELADGQCIRNVHFRENLAPHGMVFDYRLHEGPAVTRNALRVLEQEGYPPTVLAAAHDWLERRGESGEGA